MATSDLLIAAMQAVVDATTDVRLRISFGAPGKRLQVDGETKETGAAWTVPGFMDSIFKGIANVLDNWGKLNEDVATLTMGQTSFQLTNEPRTASTPSGYDLLVFKDGSKLTYSSSPGATEYSYNSSNRTVSIASAPAVLSCIYRSNS